MLTNETMSKLQDMRLGVMAKQFKEQLDDPQFASMSFEDRFSILVDAEWSTRKSNHLKSLICDRIVYDSYIIRVEGDSMRKRKGIMD